MKPYFSFQWHITDECDQRCKHCYIFAAGDHTCLKSMTWSEMQDTFYNCLDFCEVFDRTPYFYLTGGDPILHPDFWRLLDLFHEHGVKFRELILKQDIVFRYVVYLTAIAIIVIFGIYGGEVSAASFIYQGY